jgi:signal transduction histidine kinase
MGPDEHREMLEMADRQARRLRVLIEQLLLAAQSDNGRATFLSSASERVFERFTRLEPGRGLGLGLYIARQLARSQDGDLVVTDAGTAGGARFELRLPLHAPARTLAPSAAEDRAAPLRVVPGPARRSG